MAEYIELRKAKRFFNNIDSGRRGCSTLLTPTEFAEYLDEIETADVAQVRHGRWKRYSTTMMECSLCGKHTARHKFNYCPNCGAKMGLENNNGT